MKGKVRNAVIICAGVLILTVMLTVVLYYYEDMTLKEISRILEVSESRVSQLHTKALSKMQKTMGSYMGILTKV